MNPSRLSFQLVKLFLCVAATCFVAEARAHAQMSFQHVVVDASGPQGIWGKSVGDLNHDGLPDLIVGGRDGGGLLWYENPSWAKRTIKASGAFSTDHQVCDVDLDGDNDVVSLQTNSLYWYEAPSWVAHKISSVTLHDIEVFDFDGDGDCDIAGRNQGSFSGSGATLYLYTQSSPTSWSQTTRSIPDGEGLASADLDGDGDVDLVVNEVWIENRGANLGASSQHVYTSAWDHGAAYIAIADIDGDGNLDIVLSPSELAGDSYRISWFEAPADPRQSGWTEHVVDAAVESVHHFVGAGDFDRDGDTDIVAAEMQQGSDPDEVKVYRNDGDVFTKVVISAKGSHSMRVVDIDLDGDLDLFGANWTSNQVNLFVNQTPPNPLALDCSDGLDNDGDGLIDFPYDVGCEDALSDVENPQCDDGIDNDGDTLVDFPVDPTCLSSWWMNEGSNLSGDCSMGFTSGRESKAPLWLLLGLVGLVIRRWRARKRDVPASK